MTQPQKHFLILGFPVQGHLNPILQFSKRLINMGSHVTLLITVSIHRRIIDKPVIDGLSIATYSDGYDDGFTDSTDHAKVKLYIVDFKRNGQQALTNLVTSKSNSGQPFTAIIYSLYLTWVPEVARELHVPSAFFWVQPAAVLDIFYYYLRGYGDYIRGKSNDPEVDVELPGLPLMKMRDLPSFLLPSNIYSFALPLMEEHFRELEQEVKPMVLVNSFEALEFEAIRAVGKLNMVPIGPLIPSAFLDGKDPNDKSFGVDIFSSSSGYMEWLDSQEEGSVVYVSFGSLSSLAEKQMKEIACALVDAGRPFLWVIRDFDVKREEKKDYVGEEKKEEEGVNCRENETQDDSGKEEEKKEKKNGEEEGVNCREKEVQDDTGKEEKKEEKNGEGEKEVQDDTGKEEKKEEKNGEGEKENEDDSHKEEGKDKEKKNGEEEGGWMKGLEEKGRIVNWCSQVEVLSNKAVGCFVTHCGWNSTIESLVSGVPMVAFPQWTDQVTNAKLIEDLWKTGKRVVVNEEGVAESEEIRRCLDVVLGNGEKAVEMRNNAQKWKDLAREAVKEGGSSHQNLKAFVNEFAR